MAETPPDRAATPAEAEAEAVISLGGNVGDVRKTLARAIALLCEDGTVRLLARSSDYRTPPWGDENQPDFVNACILVATTLAPRALLARMQAVERTLGRDRTRERRWGPRTADLDLIDYDGRTIAEPDLVLPHLAALARAFVIVPLGEIAPDRILAGVPLREALGRLDVRGILRLEDAVR
ncbi:2-amino-4-hydroxy-6-hydroxymethyldihydropteridine pyrophosphokinase [Rhodovulum sp. PH10]|uniref:2-amino-4-hydroxy-6- hydroxymethyldihydropteridine diphosphokinase n=1 Tax=Rhodovulum sp. PH10 TaxID=1187851 RepID=UPI00027C25A7|nr:2-amino-4-hydroxy-6-hydroxymethyldihydropteridine diphosphokinase [Rhodovulum sp. PH10]EJW13704.1 2-amino-4-hydroxy-6-hydroxymethyldihydropteridine pyrophosphokinase [Rhodovulum sp. PH10]